MGSMPTCLKGTPIMGRGISWPARRSLLALRAPLAEVVDLSHHSWPVKLVPDHLQYILGSQVAAGQVHDGVDCGPRDEEVVTGASHRQPLVGV